MNEKTKQVMKRSLALMLAAILVIGAGVWMKDSRLKADEEAPAAEVVVEEAAPAEAPAPAPVEEPVVVVEEVAIAEEPVEDETVIEPAGRSEDAVEIEGEPVAAGDGVLDVPEQDAEAGEEQAEAPFDLLAAYEHYMSLATDEEKQAYLDSLAPADRKALEDYIALQSEADAAVDGLLAAPEDEAAEQVTAEAEAAPAAFASMKVSGKWAGRSTSTPRSLTVEVLVDGVMTDICRTEMNMSVANFSVDLGGCEIESELCASAGFSGGSGSYTVDMYADTSVIVAVNLISPVEEEAEAVEEAVEIEGEPVAAGDGVLDVPEQDAEAEADAEPEVKKSALLLAYEQYLEMTEDEQAAFLEGMTEKELARFEKLAELVEAEASFTVRFFDYEGNQIGEEQLVAAGASAVAPEAPFREGEEFTGWNADYSCVLSDLDISPRTDDAEKNRQVIISYAGGRSRFSVGEQVTIVSELIGFEDAESIGYQWMYSLDGETWLEVPGATDAEYSFTQTVETGTYYWKLMVNA